MGAEPEIMSDMPELIQALFDPGAYPHHPRKIELMQTQMSYVFLTDDYVYKIKKPVDFGFLDYTTLEKRRLYCQKEIELNRRLCPDAYLDVVTVTSDNGRIAIGGKGKVEEYAVEMRRLPREAMMDILLPQNKVTPEMLAKVAALLSEFHRKAATGGDIDEFGGIDTVFQNTNENFTQTEKYIGTTVTSETHRRLKNWNENFIKTNEALFHKRVAEGRIRDCHGDLHAAHICFHNGICIYDCIEFNDRFRYCDVASEVAFLAMDLDHYGYSGLSDSFIDSYVRESGDGELKKLLNFYKCYRACVRAKVGCFQYADPYIKAAEKTGILENTKSYFKLAESYI
jgi:aminoglycoside phosphotransferase family enzyme